MPIAAEPVFSSVFTIQNSASDFWVPKRIWHCWRPMQRSYGFSRMFQDVRDKLRKPKTTKLQLSQLLTLQKSKKLKLSKIHVYFRLETCFSFVSVISPSRFLIKVPQIPQILPYPHYPTVMFQKTSQKKKTPLISIWRLLICVFVIRTLSHHGAAISVLKYGFVGGIWWMSVRRKRTFHCFRCWPSN